MSINLSGDMAPGLFRGFSAAFACVINLGPCTHIGDCAGIDSVGFT